MTAMADVTSRARAAGHNGSYAGRLAYMIANPCDSEPLRLPTSDMPRTSVGKYYNTKTLVQAYPAQAHTTWQWAATEFPIIFLGIPSFMYAAPVAVNVPTGSPVYEAKFICSGADGADPSSTWGLYAASWQVGGDGKWAIGRHAVDQSWPLVGVPALNATLGQLTYGSQIPVGVIGSRGTSERYMFLNTDDTVSLYFSWTTAATLTVTGFFRRLSNEGGDFGSEIDFTTTASSTSWTLPLRVSDQPGWYRVYIGSVETTAAISALGVTAQVTPGGARGSTDTCLGWRIYTMPDFDMKRTTGGGDSNLGEYARVNACSLLMTNTLSPFNKQGTVHAARFCSEDYDWTQMNSTKMSSMKEAYRGEAALGCYTFRAFDHEEEKFRTYCDYGYLVVPLDANFQVYGVVFGGQVSTAPLQLLVTCDMITEFITSEPRYPAGTCRCDIQALALVRHRINERPVWFYENPDHMKKIYEFVKRVGGAVYNGGRAALPYVTPVVSAANPEAGALLLALAKLLR